MAFHRFELVANDVTHWRGDTLVLSYADSSLWLREWNRTPGECNSVEEYEDWLREKAKDAPRR